MMENESNAPRIIAICVVSVVLSTFFILLRLYTRLVILKYSGWEDWILVLVGVFSIGTSAVQSLRTKYGLGRHISTVPLSDVEPGLKCFYVAILLYNVAQSLLKVSFCLQYRRIFTTPIMKKACMVALVIAIIYSIWSVGASLFTCIPVAAFWDKNVVGKCLGNLQFWYITSILNIVTDLGIFLMPLPVVVKLQLPLKQKLSLLAIFAVGLCVCVISILRLHTLKVAGETKDPTWDNEAAATWSIVELNIGIICACLPSLKALLAKLVPEFSSTARSRQGWSHNYPAGSTPHIRTAHRTVIASEGSVKGLWEENQQELESIHTENDRDGRPGEKV